MTTPGEDGPFRILFVCTGNICRSPAAEILTRHLLVGRLGGREAARFDVASAGVSAVVGSGMHPDSRAELGPWGLDGAHAERFVSRQLSPGIVAGADLVLGASLRHRAAVLHEYPELVPVTFALREFARLSAAVPPETLPPGLVKRSRAVVEQVRELRGRTRAPDDDDIPDPMGGSVEAHRLAVRLTFEAVRSALDVIAPTVFHGMSRSRASDQFST